MQHAPCPGCARHVRVSELACPFCAHSPRGGFVAPPYVPPRRIGRAALLAFRVSAVATTACGSSTGLAGLDASPEPVVIDAGRSSTDAGASDSGHDAGWDAGAIVAEYGGPVFDDAGTDAGSVVDLYGAPPDPDASFDAMYGGPGA